MHSKLCCTVFLLVTLLAGTGEAKDKLKMIDTINASPRCYVLSEFRSYYVKGWKDDLGAIYTNYSNASHFLQFMNMKAKKMPEANTETMFNTAGVMFNEVTTKKRKVLLDLVTEKNGDRIRIGKIISEIYDESGCSRFSKPIDMNEYQIDEEISMIKHSK